VTTTKPRPATLSVRDRGWVFSISSRRTTRQ